MQMLVQVTFESPRSLGGPFLGPGIAKIVFQRASIAVDKNTFDVRLVVAVHQ
jgi:hypothetical protein